MFLYRLLIFVPVIGYAFQSYGGTFAFSDSSVQDSMTAKFGYACGGGSSRKGEWLCDGDDDCKGQCDDLFNGRDEQECLDLTTNEVQGMWNAFDEDGGILTDPHADSLEEIHPDDIKNALKIDDRIWDPFINDYGTSEANDVLYWIATDECIYKAIEDTTKDMKTFMKDLFLRVRDELGGSSLMEAALEPLGDEEDTFLNLADQEGNDKALKLVHDLLWEECLSAVSANPFTTKQKYIYNAVEKRYNQNSACLIGEFYCQVDSNEYIFEYLFEKMVHDELDNFIRGGDQTSYVDGLGITNSDYDDLEKVCTVVCGAAANDGIVKSGVRPSACN